MRLNRLFLTLLMVATFTLPAKATEFLDMDICIGRQIVARALCKSPDEVNYVTRLRENIYLYSTFYAKKETHFFVGVYKDMIRLQGKEFKTITSTIPYNFDKTSKCAVIDFSIPDCPTNERIICCSEKTVEDKLDDKFWNRSVPELLEEDLQNALKADNATDGIDNPEQPKP